MSKSFLSKAAAILVGFSLMAASGGAVFAEDLSGTTSARKPVTSNKAQLIQQKINTTNNMGNRMATMREKLASKEAALKLKLQAFRDQKKATISARISTNLNQINQNQTAQMQKHLDTMTAILDKLEARVNESTSIASARTAIASASALVSAQAEKDYTIQVTTESRVRMDAQTIRNKLHTDIVILRKAVIDAKQAVANAIRVAKSGSKEGTSSGQQ